MFRLLTRTILKRSLRAHLRGNADALLRTYLKMRFTQSLRLFICICWVAVGFAQDDGARSVRNRDLTLKDGTRIQFLEAGRPGLPALVLIPGWALPASLWAHQIETFSTNRQVIAIDPRSQGDSSKTDIGNTPEQRARDLNEVLTALHIPSAVLVGWSQGSQDVAAYVQQFGTSSVAGLAFVDSPVSAGPSEIEEDREWSKQFLGRLAIYANHPAEYCEGMVQSIFKKPHPGLDVNGVVAHCRKTPVSTGLTMLVMDIFGVDRRAALTKIDKPALVIASAESPLLESQKKMARAIPNAHFESIPGAGHALFVDEPEMFDSALRRLLDQSSKPQSGSKRASTGGPMSLNTPSFSCCQVVELRQYTLKPQQRDVLINLFDRHFVESQEAVGMTVIGQFRDRVNPDRFVWLRGFHDMDSRHEALEAFYGGPVWAAHKAAANDTIVDSGNVLLLKPARPDVAFVLDRARKPTSGQRPATILAGIYEMPRQIDEELVSQFEQSVAPKLVSNHIFLQGVFVTESAKNTFTRLPVREGEHVLVWFGQIEGTEVTPAWLEAIGSLSTLAGRKALLLDLEPTSRSLLGNGRDVTRATEHDFDFIFGSWKVHNRYLKERLRQSTEWIEFEASSEVTPLLHGFGHLDRYSAVRDGAQFEGITLRLFDPATGQWWIHWADTAHARTLLPPMTGRFLGGVGEFYGEEKVRATRCCAAFCGRDRGRTWLGGNRRSPKTAAGPGKRIGS